MLHIFQYLKEQQGKIENRIHCITSQEASMYSEKKLPSVGKNPISSESCIITSQSTSMLYLIW